MGIRSSLVKSFMKILLLVEFRCVFDKAEYDCLVTLIIFIVALMGNASSDIYIYIYILHLVSSMESLVLYLCVICAM